jgi:hypothetical protein
MDGFNIFSGIYIHWSRPLITSTVIFNISIILVPVQNCPAMYLVYLYTSGNIFPSFSEKILRI